MIKYKKFVVNFIEGIGIKLVESDYIPKTSFLKNVRIKNGNIIYKPKAKISDILHEAGHIAILPKKYRHFCSGDMDVCYNVIFDAAEKNGDLSIDSQVFRALYQSGENEAVAWSWAAGKHIGIPNNIIINKDQYEGMGEEMIFALISKCHLGINGLARSGMIDCVKSYPNLKKWYQE